MITCKTSCYVFNCPFFYEGGRKGGAESCPFPPAFLHASTQSFFYFSANSLYQIKFSIVLFLLFYLKNASSNQNNLLPRGKWESWFINNLWSLLWPFVLPCPFTISVTTYCLSCLSCFSQILSNLPHSHAYQTVQSPGPHIRISLLATWFGPAALLRVPSAITLLVLTVDHRCCHYTHLTGKKFKAYWDIWTHISA